MPGRSNPVKAKLTRSGKIFQMEGRSERQTSSVLFVLGLLRCPIVVLIYILPTASRSEFGGHNLVMTHTECHNPGFITTHTPHSLSLIVFGETERIFSLPGPGLSSPEADTKLNLV